MQSSSDCELQTLFACELAASDRGASKVRLRHHHRTGGVDRAHCPQDFDHATCVGSLVRTLPPHVSEIILSMADIPFSVNARQKNTCLPVLVGVLVSLSSYESTRSPHTITINTCCPTTDITSNLTLLSECTYSPKY